MSVQEFPRTTTVLNPAQPVIKPAAGAVSTSIFGVETISLALVLCVALVSHAFNMFNYPLYRQDEGIVGQQAWSFLQDRVLSPYTYTYEHPPMATFMLSVWTILTGGFHTFGPSINSGRVLMLVMHLASSFFVYRVARQLSGSIVGALITGLLFSLSPLAVNFQRLVVVDNFMVFWLSMSLYFLVCNRGRLFSFFLASMALGLAVLSRETALIFVPAFMIIVLRFSHPLQRLYAIWGAAIIGGVLTLQFLLYSVFKSELFPDAFNFWGELNGTATHVSLFGTLWQNYKDTKPSWEVNSSFGFIWNFWLGVDGILIAAGVACMALNLVFGFRKKENWLVPLMAGSYGIYMVLGGIQADYQVVPFVLFLALAIGQTVGWASRTLGATFGFVIAIAIVALSAFFYVGQNQAIYNSDVNNTDQQVLLWMKGNIPTDRIIVGTDALWVDMHSNYNGPAYKLYHSHYKADQDPDIYAKLLDGKFKNIDYLVTTTEIRKQVEQAPGRGLVRDGLKESSLVRQFDGKEDVQINKINNLHPLMETNVLKDGFNFFRNKYIAQDGKVSDATGKASADWQANAMLMALWSDEQKTFDNLWFWTAYNLQMDNSLFKSDSGPASARTRSNTDSYTNTRSDIDLAMALVLGNRRWKDTSYLTEAKYILKGIWDNEIIVVNKKPYLKATASPTAQVDNQVLINLGAFSPQAFRLFAEVDKDHDWMALYNSGYELLNKAAWYGRGDYKGLGLPPGLMVMNTETEELRGVEGTFGARLGDFDEEAEQALWRVSLDYRWFRSPQAKQYISDTGWFLVKYWQRWKSLAPQYTSNGVPLGGSPTLSNYAVVSAQAGILDEIELAKKRAKGEPAELGGASVETEIVARVFMGEFYRDKGQGYWVNQDDIDLQQWGWMGTALHLNSLNLNFESLPARPEFAQGR